MEASNIYINSCVKKTDGKVEYKIGKEWFEFRKIATREAVLADSLFLRYMKRSITRLSGDVCKDFIVVKFNYDAVYRMNNEGQDKIDKHELRKMYYREGVTYTVEKKNRKGEVVDTKEIHYRMLMRSPGKAKDGECVFIRDNLHHKAINYLTMGLYNLMDKESRKDPDKVFKLVELSAYLTLTTATAIDYIQIPLENILIVKDEETFSDEMNAAIVKSEDVAYTKDIFKVDFDNPRTEKIINKKGFTFNEDIANKTGLKFISEKSKESLKENGIRINGRYPGWHETIEETKKECTVTRDSSAKIKNVLWDGMGIADESIFPKNMDGFIYCRSHFFKSCLFRGNVQEFFKDYCRENGINYDSHTLEKVDMFERKLNLKDIKVIITDKSIKWLKFIDMMGDTEKRAYKYYRRYMEQSNNFFSIVKTAHPSKWGDLQLMAYQMNNSLPTTDKRTLESVSECAVNFINDLKMSDETYLQYLDMKKDKRNINELLIELVKWNGEFAETEFFRKKKTRDISDLKNEYFKQGKLLQNGDNLTIMDNPIALLMKAVGNHSLDEGCFEVLEDGVQCYAPRFADGDRIAAFRSPHNSPNNIIHLYNVYPDKLLKYFPHIGQNVIVFNAIKTDTQARLSGHDVDSDFVYATNHSDLSDLARKAYVKYPTIINEVKELSTSGYHFTLDDFANMDNKIADAQKAIGTSTDTAQLALSYYFDENMSSQELEDCFIILSVIGQISIDLAKKSFDIDVVREINRIKKLSCMKDKGIPLFFASIKNSRNNKEFDENDIKSMNCPMDIIGEIIEEKMIKYASRICHKLLRDFWNTDTECTGEVNRYKKDKVIAESKKYNSSIEKLECDKDKMDDDTFFLLKDRIINQFLNKVSMELNQETIMQLVIYATEDDNSDVRATILNFLFRNYYNEFMNCFVKKSIEIEQNICIEPPKTA